MKCFFTKSSVLLVAMLLLSSLAMAQFTVNGNVKDGGGQPLIGVSIVVKGTSQGTVTDFDGNFILEVSSQEATLMFSYTGFKTREVAVSTSNSRVDLVMDEDIARLEEVIVTGLASGVKRSNSGTAVTAISADELNGNTNAQTLDYAIYGKIPGVQMTSNSGAPGGGINVQLRGVSTLGAGNSQPLYIIDGVYVDNSTIRNGRTNLSGASGGQNASNQDDAANRIADINPDDIERIEVLKGPSAAAIYGTRANAGVIIITTKKGTAGDTKISLSQDIGMAQGQNFQNFEAWDEEKITRVYGGDRLNKELEAYRQAVAAGRITDWEEFFYGETGLLSNTSLSISGGNQKTQFFVSGGAQTETGIIKNTGFDRFSVRANLDHEVVSGVRLSFNTNYVNTTTERGFTGNQNNTGGSIGYNIAYVPTYANLFPDENGNYPDNPYFDDNPIAIRDLGTNRENVDRFITAVNLDVDLLQTTSSFLKLKINGGVDYLSGNTLAHLPEILQSQRALANPGDVFWGRQDNLNTNIQGFLVFNTNFGTINSNTTVGAVRLDQDSKYALNRGQGLSAGQTNLRWAKVTETRQQVNSTVTDIGLVAQQDFNWEDKIIASLGIRFDRSTLNTDQDKYYAFPKASLAANIANFDFWTFKDIVNQLKLRAAYGETGGLPNYGSTFEVLVSQLIGGSLGGQVSNIGVDPNLRPETANEIELGLDAALFDSRITLEATYYNKAVDDLILNLVPASSTGITAISTNAADLENKGVELGLGVNPIRKNNLNWFAKVLYWQNRSEITRLDIPAQTTGGFGPGLGTYLIAEGYSPTTIVGNPAGTTIPTGRTIYGDRQPDFQMSFLSQLNFLKNFDFNFLFHWQKGSENINLSALLWDDGKNAPDYSQDDDGDEIVNGEERLGIGNPSPYIQPASYVKLREISLYYTLPKGIFGKVIDRAKIGVSGNNFLLWTDYGSYDPEVSNFGAQPVNGSVEVSPYPSARRLFFHLKLDF
ncbi:MAG: SusC/RagA family TonB-linked outer membrane protein [Saprospiraceae bacterium]|nr:SusC/RagA family TonB-linked outer membrane protein [Saprospiraceae bacterium]